MPLDKGRVVDVNGEIHQSSLRQTTLAQKTSNLSKTVLGIVLRTYPSDVSRNLMTHYFSDRHAFVAVCDVIVVNDGQASVLWRLSNVMIPASHAGGLDNYEESLPRGSSKYINGEDFDISSHENDLNDLDGDWCVINFIGGNINVPYITNWWPHPRNTFDPQTFGEGHPNSQGEGQALEQFKNGRGRYLRRINGVEQVINERGDIFLSTYYSNGDLTPNPDGDTERGRFSRSVDFSNGGGIRINVKTTQAMELNWNPQEDGIGLGDTFDPSLAQTNPPQTRPYYSGNREALFIRLQNKAAIFETPSLFRVDSADQIRLASSGDTYQIIGGSRQTTVDGIMNTVVDSDITTTSTAGDIDVTATQGNISRTATAGGITDTAFDVITVISQEGDINITAELGNYNVAVAEGNISLDATAGSISLTAGGAIGIEAGSGATVDLGSGVTQPLLKGTTYTGLETTLYTALGVFATAVAAAAGVSSAGDVLNLAITAWINALANPALTPLTTSVTVGD